VFFIHAPCLFCSMSLLFDYMCMRLPFIPWSIAGLPSSQALLGFIITAPPSVCVPTVIGALVVWIQNQKKTPPKLQLTHTHNYSNKYDPYICYQHTNTSLQTTFHILNTLPKDNTHSKHKRQQDNTRSKHKTRQNKTNK